METGNTVYYANEPDEFGLCTLVKIENGKAYSYWYREKKWKEAPGKLAILDPNSQENFDYSYVESDFVDEMIDLFENELRDNPDY